jgi:hypothetical protein
MDWVGAQARAQLNNGAFTGTSALCGWILTPEDAAKQFTNPTLMATRMKTAVNLYTGASFVGDFCFAAVGLIEWSGLDALVPALSPDPILDTDFDWIIRHVFPVPALTGAGQYDNEVTMDTEYTSQAKRRLETSSGLLLCFAVEGAGFTFSADVRCLIKE